MALRDNISYSLLFFSFSSLIHIIVSSAVSPHAFVFPMRKHARTLKHTITIHQRTPLAAIDVTVDLGGAFLWVTTGSAVYGSTTYESPLCHSPQCSLAQQPTNDRHKCDKTTTCIIYHKNIFNGRVSRMKLSEDVLNLQYTDGFNPTSNISTPHFLFLSAPHFHSRGKPLGAKGVAGLGHGKLALPSQISTNFNVSRKFSVCFSPSPNKGVLFFGDGPYVFYPGIDLSKVLISTPLYLMPKNRKTHHHSPIVRYEYFIKVTLLRVNGKGIALQSPVLAKLSSNIPYTIFKSSIYTKLSRVFIHQATRANFSRVARKGPFDMCFSTRNHENQIGDVIRLSMPFIDFVLQDERFFWRIFGLNSMVRMGNDTICLGILDGGASPEVPIRIGSHFLEDNLLQFDLESSSLGFTNLLLRWGTNCASFNFTTNV